MREASPAFLSKIARQNCYIGVRTQICTLFDTAEARRGPAVFTRFAHYLQRTAANSFNLQAQALWSFTRWAEALRNAPAKWLTKLEQALLEPAQ